MKGRAQTLAIANIAVAGVVQVAAAGDAAADVAANARAPVVVDAAYTADWLRNQRGGLQQGSALLQNIDLVVKGRFTTGLSPRAATATAHLLYNDRTTFSDRFVGDVHIVSSIETGEAFRLFQLWYEQPIAQRWSSKVGLFDLNSEFDVIDTAALFVNSSHGMGYDFAQSGVNGPSSFPVTSLGARLQFDVNERHTLRYAALDGVPGDPDDPSRTAIKLSSDDGVLHTAQWDWSLRNLRFAAGYWRYSAEFEDLRGNGGSDAGRTRDGNDGFYLLSEGSIGFPGRPLRWFVRYGQADEAFNEFGEYLGFGVAAPFGPPEGEIGLAVATAKRGPASSELPRDSRETAIELTYRMQVTPWLSLQPDVQYVINPGTDPGLSNALVIGVRAVLSARREWNDS